MAPIAADQPTPEPCFDIGSQGITLNHGIIIICLLLIFYALALWDRWMTLKLYERQRLQGRVHVNYGAIESGITITRTPSPKLDSQCTLADTVIPTPNAFLAPPIPVDPLYSDHGRIVTKG